MCFLFRVTYQQTIILELLCLHFNSKLNSSKHSFYYYYSEFSAHYYFESSNIIISCNMYEDRGWSYYFRTLLFERRVDFRFLFLISCRLLHTSTRHIRMEICTGLAVSNANAS